VTIARSADSNDAETADVVRAIALLSEGLLSEAEFKAITGLEVQDVLRRLANAATLVHVQTATLQLRNSGALARLEAMRHAREAVNVAAGIMRDTDMHPSTRLNAATFIAKASGTERSATESEGAREPTRIIINFGGHAPIVVANEAARSMTSPPEEEER
jgi:hypothetical protein